MSKIFVTCAAGNVGLALTAALIARSEDVVAGVHDPDKAETLKKMGVDVRPIEFEDQDSLTRAMTGCDKLFLLLPFAERMSRWGHVAVEAAKGAGIEFIVRSSGYAAASDAHWRLGREHGIIDQFVESSGIPAAVLRPNSFMQNYANMLAPAIRDQAVILMPEADATVSYIDVRDIAACAVALFAAPDGHAGRVYALTGPAPLGQAEVAAAIAKAAGKPVTYENIPEEAYIEGLLKAGVPQWNVNMLVSLTRVIKLGMMGNVTKAVEHLTGAPARTFEAFAEEHAHLWK